MKAEPRPEHQWLEKLVGDWTYESEALMAPGQPPQKFSGSESVRSIGGLWVLCEGQGEMPGGGTAKMFMTLGYDPLKQRYVGTWFGSMMTHLWIYDGQMDASGTTLTLSAEGPDMEGKGNTTPYQDIIEIKSDDYRTLSSRSLQADGTWNHFMTAHYRRTK